MFGISFPFCSKPGGKLATDTLCPYSYSETLQQKNHTTKKKLHFLPQFLCPKQCLLLKFYILMFYIDQRFLSQPFFIPILPSQARFAGQREQLEASPCSVENSWKGKQLEGDRGTFSSFPSPSCPLPEGFFPPSVHISAAERGDVAPDSDPQTGVQ